MAAIVLRINTKILLMDFISVQVWSDKKKHYDKEIDLLHNYTTYYTSYTIVGADGAVCAGQCLCIWFWAWSYHRSTRLVIRRQLAVGESKDPLEPMRMNWDPQGQLETVRTTWHPYLSLITANLNFSHGAANAFSSKVEDAEERDLAGAVDTGATTPHRWHLLAGLRYVACMSCHMEPCTNHQSTKSVVDVSLLPSKAPQNVPYDLHWPRTWETWYSLAK